MRPFYWKAAAVLLGIWLIAGGVIYLVRSSKATPESVAAYATAHPLEGKSPAERDEVLQKLASRMNQLNYDQRRELRMGHKLETVYKSLTPEEQGRFMDLTLPEGFKQMMEAFNNMDPAKRKEWVDKALADMQRHGEEQSPPPDDPNLDKMVQHGMAAFYSNANAGTKMDLAPLIEQLQHNAQGFH